MPARIFRYVVRYDAGSAPRPFDGFCTLAICKPMIRATAAVGDWIIGFRTQAPADVIYVMQVEEVLSFAEYWRDTRFRNRRPGKSPKPDNIYRPTARGFQPVANPVHGPDAMAKDLSGQNVLVSRRFWYFGKQSPMMPTELIHLVHASRGHSVNKGRRDDDVDRLVEWLSAWAPGIHGRPVLEKPAAEVHNFARKRRAARRC